MIVQRHIDGTWSVHIDDSDEAQSISDACQAALDRYSSLDPSRGPANPEHLEDLINGLRDSGATA